ncbi:SusC/RagA family TonB-linked outer membrane protein [Hymenobacter ruricola]|uniref:SusC/RagA family TonB-linked outer membrane protein n=1 Tax=Hymenobacter ruricola TaxID=2791023 RepID=A0ABS0I712_9BACT|nr:SusC/RagA family TonB-linked outer membrane protein [Hymenobacter ruricola]MBF9222347.1 SusC/RagA family TonB-linked outer membrane protein [Hymenobacter ruricola]
MKHPYLAKLLFLLLFAAFGLPTIAQAQTGTVSGRVTDGKNEAIPGATVLIEGTSVGSSSGVDGSYTIANVPAGNQTVVISFVGYNSVRRPVTVAAGQTAEVSASLSENTTQLSEAVVVGYGTQRRQDVTGSLTTVSSKDFVQGQITNPEQLIQGKVAGVQITTGGGAPGAATTIRIRGGSSLNASNDPLIVIDGVPVDNTGITGASNALSLINPNDIDTYTVLKDASATAIYGSRASNGVILITTKKGLAGEKFTVTLNSQTSLSRRYNSVPVLSAGEYRATVARVAPSQVKLLGTANTNWQDEVFQNAMTYDNTVSLSGAVGKLPFRASYGNLSQEGILITNRLIRNTGSLSLNPVLFDNTLRINLNLKGSWVDNNFADNGAIGSAAAFDPTQPVTSNESAFAGYGGYFEYLQGNGTPQKNVPVNPVAQLRLTRDRSSVKRSIGNIQLDYALPFLRDLHANVNLGYDVTRSNGYKLIDARSAGSYFNSPLDPTNTTSRGGSFGPYSQNRDNKLLETYLNYTKQFGGNNRLELLGGYSYQDFTVDAPAYKTFLADGTVSKEAATPYFTQYTILSFYGRANLTIKDRYVFTGTLRDDASSRFPTTNRHALFPAASVAWRVKEESFLKDVAAVSDLKLRVGYGITGQQDVAGISGDYPYLQRFVINTPTALYPFGPNFLVPYSPQGYNRNLKWEQTTTYNAGLDLGFLGGRLNGSVDVYYRKTKDLLAVIPVPGLINFTNQLVSNVGSLENKGIEFNLNANPVQGEHFQWTLNANATYNENKILSLGPQAPGFVGIDVNPNAGTISGGTGTTIGVYTVGGSSSAFYVYKQAYAPDGKPIDGVYADLNGDKVVDTNDRYLYKQAAPKVILGFSSNLSYDRLSLAFTLRSQLGNYVYNNINSNNGNYQGILASSNFVSNVTKDANYTMFTATAQQRFSSDYYIQNASFLRMENITLGYNVGKVFNSQGNLRLTAAVQNVFLVTKYTGLDPEVFTGIDNNVYPRPRTFTFGLNLSL